MEGHSRGGGILKLDSTEAEQVAAAVPTLANDAFAELCQELDGLLWAGQHDLARQRADECILRRGVGLDADEPSIRLFTASPKLPLQELSEAEYFSRLREIYNVRNPHAQIESEELATGEENQTARS